MKKFIHEFKEFALKGNVMNLAVGVIIGAAFQSIVTALTSSLLIRLLQWLQVALMEKALLLVVHLQ